MLLDLIEWGDENLGCLHNIFSKRHQLIWRMKNIVRICADRIFQITPMLQFYF